MSGEEVTYLHDQLGRLIASETIEPYFYSTRNERIVVRRTGSPDEVNFYGADGLLLGVYKIEQHPNMQHGWVYPVRIDEKERVYFGGRLIGVGSGSGGTQAIVTDRLGSVVKNGTQTYLYYPYGQEIGAATANDTAKYATYTRDSWSGLDYAMNRFYKNEWGRFTSPDPYQASGGVTDPGSWNRYAYVGGDPVNFNDSSGLRKDACNEEDSPPCHYRGQGLRNENGPWIITDTYGTEGWYTAFEPNWDYDPTQRSSGGGGGSGGSTRIISKQQAKAQLNGALKSIADGCFKKLGTSREDVIEKAGSIMFFDGRASGDGNSNIISILGPQIGVSPDATFNSISTYANAVTLPYVSRSLSRYVVLGASFFTKGQADQWITLAHEAFHYTLDKWDLDFNAQTGYRGNDVGEASARFTEWLKGKCI